MAATFSPQQIMGAAQQFVTFLNKAVTPFHAVEECTALLRAAGFVELRETDEWRVNTAGKYYMTRNRSALLAFVIGGAYKPGNGCAVVGAHTDSPVLRVKPVSKISGSGTLQVGVSCYGGGLWRTWFDRDLSVAGRVYVRSHPAGTDGRITQHLVRVNTPLLYIPNLCIHLDTERDKPWPFNKEDHLRPILATEAMDKLNVRAVVDGVESTGVQRDHHSALVNIIAKHVKCSVEDIVDFELCLYDTQPAAIGGVHSEFIAGARLDNLVGTYTAITGLIQAAQDGSVSDETMIRVAACYDNEECGSESAQGACSALTEWVLRRVCTSLSAPFEQTMARSFLISADQAHAVHPNYESRHERNHRPLLHGGVVMKINDNQRYATTSVTQAVLREVAAAAGVPVQRVCVRNDSACGSTIGPLLSTRLAMRTVDVGMPQWAMHSIREVCCTSSIAQATALYAAFYKHCARVLAQIDIE